MREEKVRTLGREGRKREGKGKAGGCEGEALGTLPFPQERAEPSVLLPFRSPRCACRELFSSSCGCRKVLLLLPNTALQKGEEKKEIPQEVQIFYYFLFVQSMSTLGTRCAICLELRCQLDRMSFFLPLSRSNPERAAARGKRARRNGALGGA